MSVYLNVGIFSSSDFFDSATLRENLLFATFHDFIGSCVIRVGMFDDLILTQVIFKVSIRQGIWINRCKFLDHLKCDNPAWVNVLNALITLKILHIVAVFVDVFLNLRHKVIALLILDTRPPAEVVESKVFKLQVFE